MFLCYEQMLADPPTHIRKIADFAGIGCTPEILRKVTDFFSSEERIEDQVPPLLAKKAGGKPRG